MDVDEREKKRSGTTVTLAGLAVNGFLILLKFSAGIQGHSQALVADAVHSVSDCFTDLIVLIGLKIGQRAPDQSHHFGHARIETLASGTVGLALIITALYLGLDSASAIYNKTALHPGPLALIGAAVSILFKEGLYHYTVRTGKRIGSPLVVANAWHHRSDALSSVAVLLGVGAAQIVPAWHVLDSYAALLVSFFIVKVGLQIFAGMVKEITDTAPPPETMKRIHICARSVTGVEDIHDLRVRTTAGRFQMEVHIVVDGSMSVREGHRIAKSVETCLINDIPDMERVIIHVDPREEEGQKEDSSV